MEKERTSNSSVVRPNFVINPKAVLTKSQAKSTYVWKGQYRNGKPVFQIPTRKIISMKSAFEHKKLCDGPTFTLGLSCSFSCTFCYVSSLLGRNPSVLRILKDTGLGFHQAAIERKDPMPVLRRELITRNGCSRFSDPADQRVIFASPLMDVAANLAVARQTIEACKLILERTHWQIRLLSKSALLKMVAEELHEYRDRIILGVSTGTIDDQMARCFEIHASSPTARLRTLHWLQDNGFRTYAMLCPSLPQEDYAAFARTVAQAVRVDRCEHVWAEVFNIRGKSLSNTCAGLRNGGFAKEAEQLERVSKAQNRAEWEEYARNTFLAHAANVPPGKLRFMQYVQKGQAIWWKSHAKRGALLLGRKA